MTVAAAITLAVLTAGFNLLLRSNLDARREPGPARRAPPRRSRGSASREARCTSRRAPIAAAPDTRSGSTAGRRAIERPAAPQSVQRLADSLAGGPKTHAEDPSTDLRLLAVPVAQGGTRVGTVVSAISLEPYEHSASKALTGSLIYAGAAFLLVLIATRLIVNRALRPVARMTAEAADWSEHDLDHRFNVGEPYDELTQLAATFDDMLARLASEPAPRAAALGRALPRAQDAAGRDRHRGRARAATRSWHRGVSRGAPGDRLTSGSDAEDPRDPDGGGTGRVDRGAGNGRGGGGRRAGDRSMRRSRAGHRGGSAARRPRSVR